MFLSRLIRSHSLHNFSSQAVIAPLKHVKAEVTISERCADRLRRITAGTPNFLRVAVEGGGCSGFTYKFDLDAQLNPDDKVFEQSGAKIVIDATSLDYIKGATVDYQEELIRSAFKIVNNPLAEQGCSCGASFALRLD